MQAERRRGLPPLLCRLWAGLECGMLTGLLILVWFAAHSLFRGEFWWSKYNVAAGWFYGAEVYHAGLGGVTLCGVSLLIVFYCLAGALFAFGWDALFSRRAFLTGSMFVIGLHLVATRLFLPSFGPFARLWYPWTATAPAHFVLFVILMRYPIFYRRLLNEFGDPGWFPGASPLPPSNTIENPSPAASFEAPGDASSPAEPSKD